MDEQKKWNSELNKNLEEGHFLANLNFPELKKNLS
jgi:hypothetical protein